MAATYPPLLASGVNSLGRFDQFDLMAGDGPFTDDWGQAADGAAISQFQTLMRDAAGRLVPLTTAGDYATGTITVGGQPVATNTVSVNAHAITFVAAGTPTATQVLIGATAADTAAAIAAVINSDPVLYAVTASVAGTVITLTANAVGTAGNAVALAEAVTDAGFTVSGATLAGANAAEDVPSGNFVAVAMQPVSAATPGAKLPIRISGGFNHEALIWPAGLGTLAQRQRACEGTPIHVHQLL